MTLDPTATYAEDTVPRPNEAILQWSTVPCRVEAYDGSSFVLWCDQLLTSHQNLPSEWLQVGLLRGAEEEVEVSFHVLSVRDEHVRCRFHGLAQESQPIVDAILKHVRIDKIKLANLPDPKTDVEANTHVQDQTETKAEPTVGSNVPSANRIPEWYWLGGLAAVLIAAATLLATKNAPSDSIEIAGVQMLENHVPLKSPVRGKVQEVIKTAGSTVKRGDIILRVASANFQTQNKTDLQSTEAALNDYRKELAAQTQAIETMRKTLDAELSESKAAVNHSVATVGRLEAKRVRLRPLVQSGVVSEAEAQELETQLMQAKAAQTLSEAKVAKLALQLKAHEQQATNEPKIASRFAELRTLIADAERRIDQLTSAEKSPASVLVIAAPADGVLETIDAQEGQLLQFDQQVAEIRTSENEQLNGFVDKTLADKIAIGQNVVAHGGDQRLTVGQISQIKADVASSKILVVVDLNFKVDARELASEKVTRLSIER